MCCIPTCCTYYIVSASNGGGAWHSGMLIEKCDSNAGIQDAGCGNSWSVMWYKYSLPQNSFNKCVCICYLTHLFLLDKAKSTLHVHKTFCYSNDSNYAVSTFFWQKHVSCCHAMDWRSVQDVLLLFTHRLQKTGFNPSEPRDTVQVVDDRWMDGFTKLKMHFKEIFSADTRFYFLEQNS